MSTNEQLIGRADIDDLEAILAVSAPDQQESIRAVKDNADAIFTWDYEKGSRPALNKLYEKAKVSMWNGETDLPWDTVVDQEEVARNNAVLAGGFGDADLTGTPFATWGDKEWTELGMEFQNWSLSQFMHGEQGALICTAKIVETVPWIDAKYYASTQVMDEARHVEVFARYLDTKLSGHYPLNAHLGLLLDDIIADSRWDMTYLGMQIMVEGLALAAFGFMHQMTTEPLLKKLLRYVMSDEARHVAFGVLTLKEYYA
ncbi:MAG: ferritin-like domain-containing protein, partial [Acidimicrobiia bacterium]|nr:ferritin-like domain-containing protein [Acidimicrobiia bacterium]